MAARETKKTPSANSIRIWRATSRPTRVLPIPPGPTKVSKRTPASRSHSQSNATSGCRPMSDVVGAGRRKLGWGAACEEEGGAVLGIGGGEARREDGSSRLRGLVSHSCSEKL